MMKSKLWRLLLLLGFLFVAGMRICLAWGPIEQHDIGVLENYLFHQVYEQETPNLRLKRVEETVFGTSRDILTPEERIVRLRQAVPIPKQPVGYPPLPVNPGSIPTQNTAHPPTILPGESDYPIVDEMEKRVLKQTFVKEDLTLRLPRLERQVFGSPQTGELMSRVDRLHDVVLGGSRSTGHDEVSNSDTPPYLSSDPNETAASDSNIGNTTISPEQVGPAVATIEKQLFHKNYPQEAIESRLSRIEMKLFNKAASEGLSPQERLSRIVSVASAGGQNPTSPRSPNAALAMQLLPVVLMLLPLFI